MANLVLFCLTSPVTRSEKVSLGLSFRSVRMALLVEPRSGSHPGGATA